MSQIRHRRVVVVAVVIPKAHVEAPVAGPIVLAYIV